MGIWKRLRQSRLEHLIDGALRTVRSRQRILDQREEACMHMLIRLLLRADSNCADVGAHNGAILQRCMQVAPHGRHFAFEPLPSFIPKIRDRCPGAVIHQCAVGPERKKVEFCFDRDDPGLSGLRLRPERSAGHAVERFEVEMKPLDDLIPEDVDIHLLKVDVEGAELGVFRSGRRTILRSRPYIVFEHGQGGAEHFDTRPEDVHDLLVTDYGLRMFTITGVGPLDRDAFRSHFDHRKAGNYLAKP